MPNLPIPNPLAYAVPGRERGEFQTYAWTGIEDAGKGRLDAFGREQSFGQALASSSGIKLNSYPTDELRRNRMLELRRELQEMAERRRKAARELSRGGMTPEQFESKMEDERKRVSDRVGSFVK